MSRDPGREALTRTFLAVFPPRAVVDELESALGALRVPGDGISWVKHDNVHYTLRFLGGIPPNRVEAARRAAAAAVVGIAPFVVRLGGTGVFPNERRPRVLWLGARDGDAGLRLLAGSLDVALGREGFGPADKPFASHLTVGRVREGAPGGGVEAVARFRAAALPEPAFPVEELVLVASTLSPGGSIYRRLGSFRLDPRTGGADHPV